MKFGRWSAVGLAILAIGIEFPPWAYTVALNACDVNADGTVTVTDLQSEVNQALAIVSCAHDLNADTRCDVSDVQILINSILSGTCSATTGGNTNTRNVLLQPFASNSIWNMPIGSGAQYTAAGITAPGTISGDEDILIMTPTAPITPVDSNNAGWQTSPLNRCDFNTYPNKAAGFSVPVPTNFILDNSLPGMGGTPNNSGAVLLADNRTISQFQPLQRCSVGGVVTYLTGARWANVDLYGDGIIGSHGGSGLSALGGAIRLGELRPGNSPIVTGVNDVIRHALKFEFDYAKFDKFGPGPFWPANLADGGNEGLLLALLPTFNYNSLKTAPGRSIAWTLINYGAYIADATGWDAVQICIEFNVSTLDGKPTRVYDQFKSDWGYVIEQNGTSNAWAQDIKTIMQSLQVITNNKSTAIGGGGTPRQPLAPAVTAPN